MKNVIENKKASNKVKNEKTLFVKENNTILVSENLGGKKLDKAIKKEKKKNAIVEARKEAVKDYLEATTNLSQVLKNIKQFNAKYLKVIELEYSIKISADMLNSVIPSNFVHLQTEKQKEAQAKNPNLWSFRKVLQLIAKYYKSEADKLKIVEKVAKLNLA